MIRLIGRRAFRMLVVATAAVLAVVVVVGAVKYSNGAFSGQYPLSATFPQSGEGLHPGSEVVYRGVQVGRVTSITLDSRKANVKMGIDPSFKLPSDATATIKPLNVFGADQIVFSVPSAEKVSALRPGATIRQTAVSPELGDLFAAAAPLLDQIDTTDLNTVISTLAQASEGMGPTIARSIDDGAKFASLLERTLPQQLSALDSFSGFVNTLAPTATSFNAISRASNVALPAFNSAAQQYAHLLQTLAPFAERIAQFLAAYHPDFEKLLNSGDNVARVILAQQDQLGQVIQGLGLYAEVFAKATDPAEVLPDGSHFGYFQTIVSWGDVNQLVCSLLAPAVPGLSALEPLQQALTGPGMPFNCSSQLAAFMAAQSRPAPSAPPQASQQAAQQLSTGLYQALGQPQSAPSAGGVGQIIGTLLGGGSTAGGGSGGSPGPIVGGP